MPATSDINENSPLFMTYIEVTAAGMPIRRKYADRVPTVVDSEVTIHDGDTEQTRLPATSDGRRA
jgi:hypothetical protein